MYLPIKEQYKLIFKDINCTKIITYIFTASLNIFILFIAAFSKLYIVPIILLPLSNGFYQLTYRYNHNSLDYTNILISQTNKYTMVNIILFSGLIEPHSIFYIIYCLYITIYKIKLLPTIACYIIICNLLGSLFKIIAKRRHIVKTLTSLLTGISVMIFTFIYSPILRNDKIMMDIYYKFENLIISKQNIVNTITLLILLLTYIISYITANNLLTKQPFINREVINSNIQQSKI